MDPTTSKNISFGESSINNFQFYKMFKVGINIISAVLLFCILLGNTLTICAVMKFKWLQNKTNYVLFSLAVADILVGFATGTRIMFQQMSEIRYCQNAEANFIVAMVESTAYQISALHIITIAWERYRAVVQPLKYHRMSVKNLFLVILLPWVLSVGITMVTIGVAFFFGVKNVCMHYSQKWIFADTIINLIIYFSGLLLVIITSIKVLLALQKHSKETVTIMNANLESQKKFSRREAKTTKMLIAVISAYIFAWMPHFILRILMISNVHIEEKAVWALNHATLLIGFNNSAVNVLLYATGYKEFKRGYMYLIACKHGKELQGRVQDF